MWGKLVRRTIPIPTRLERLETTDGDFLDLHHLDGDDTAPLLILLHGLEGGIRSHYIQGLLREARDRGWKAAVLIFRSCGDEPNRTRRFYHSGETSDLDFAIQHLVKWHPGSPVVLAGASLGGNVLLKYLGERSASVHVSVKAAAAVSVPFDLGQSSRHIDRGFAKIYQRHFIHSLRRKVIDRLVRFPDLVSRKAVDAARTMFDFDDAFTAPVHGFSGAHDYYTRSSSLKWLGKIRINTLLINSVDDPFLPAQVLDEARMIAKVNSALHIEFPSKGGHVGFVSGPNPLRPFYYMERRVGDFLAEQLASAHR